jgi:uncharacterized membrane protein YadS
VVALAAYFLEPVIAAGIKAASGWTYKLPAIVIALIIGIALNPFASKPAFEPGMTWCVKKLLRVAISLLGVRIALSDIVDLGFGTAFLVVLAMVGTGRVLLTVLENGTRQKPRTPPDQPARAT